MLRGMVASLSARAAGSSLVLTCATTLYWRSWPKITTRRKNAPRIKGAPAINQLRFSSTLPVFSFWPEGGGSRFRRKE